MSIQLKKCVYGLSDASRYWYDRVSKEFESRDGVKSCYDMGIFIWNKHDCRGVICFHVDEFRCVGSRSFFTQIESRLSQIFKIGTAKPLPHAYLGLQLTAESPRGFAIDQSLYAK